MRGAHGDVRGDGKLAQEKQTGQHTRLSRGRVRHKVQCVIIQSELGNKITELILKVPSCYLI